MTPPWARRAADALLAALLHPSCAACERLLPSPTRGPVCADCWSTVRAPVPPLCRTCGASLPSWRELSLAEAQCPTCRRTATAIDLARAAGTYDGALRAIIHAFKYDARHSLASPLAAAMRRIGEPVLAHASCVVPVPLHPWRRLTRGFNQATVLARGLGLPVVPALWRRRATLSQAALSAAARRRNVRGAFGPSPCLRPATRRRHLDGAIVVLVDDVSTTGATLDACARVLKAMGAREVRALTAAKAEPRAPRR